MRFANGEEFFAGQIDHYSMEQHDNFTIFLTTRCQMDKKRYSCLITLVSPVGLVLGLCDLGKVILATS